EEPRPPEQTMKKKNSLSTKHTGNEAERLNICLPTAAPTPSTTMRRSLYCFASIAYRIHTLKGSLPVVLNTRIRYV
ncbi:hypothetical protein CEXT_296121, partial [Caerostris extrusa]